jgi:hypothetical protein
MQTGLEESKMYTQQLLKSDGRKLTLYSRYPIIEEISALAPAKSQFRQIHTGVGIHCGANG